MNILNRRNFLMGTVALAALAGPAWAIDIAELNKEPAFGEMTMGPADAKVTVIEYASASCPHCAAFYNDTFPKLKAEYIDTNKIKFVFREYPHNDAALAAFMLARSVPKDAYFPMVDIFFKTQNAWLENPHDGLLNIARQAGFTPENFEKLLKDQALAKSILDVRDKGSSFGVEGIPTFFVNGELFRGDTSIEEFRKKLDPLLG